MVKAPAPFQSNVRTPTAQRCQGELATALEDVDTFHPSSREPIGRHCSSSRRRAPSPERVVRRQSPEFRPYLGPSFGIGAHHELGLADHPELTRTQDRLGPAPHLELLVELADVRLDGIRRDFEAARDFLV